ncbi:MAG: protein kinase, partial [Micrococcales bacterium]|nr:protein kinase [Micrococcales bacterium]
MIPLGPFELDQPIGTGGMGQVWSGFHAGSWTPVAVKVLTGPAARAPRYVEGFRNEARSAASLDHPAIVVVYDHGEIPEQTEQLSGGALVAGSPYLVMERLPGGTLSDLRARMQWPHLRAALLDVLAALAHAHARGVIHRDVKPSNVLVQPRPDGGTDALSVKLSDFGLAHPFERLGVERDSLQIVGTPAFMAPEQLLSRWHDYGPWTDLFSFGCLAYTLVAGHAPWAHVKDTMAPQLYRQAPPLHSRVPVPEGFEAWVARLLEREPVHRFARAADAAWALLALTGSVGDTWTIRVDGDAVRAEPSSHGSRAEAVTAAETRPVAASPIGPALSAGLPVPGAVEVPPIPATWRVYRPETQQWLAGAGLGLFGLRRVPLVGRDAERDLLWAALRAVAGERRARLVVLRGPAGCGKSRLAEWLGERAAEVGAATVLRATHSRQHGPADGLGPMVARLVRCRDRQRAHAVARTREVLTAAGVDDPVEALAVAEMISPAEATEGTGAAVRFGNPTERHEVVRRLLERVCAERTAIVWLDDVQWGDDALALVAHVLGGQQTRPLPVLFVATARSDETTPAEERLLGRLVVRPDASVLEIGPLPEEARPALVRELLGLDGPLAEQVEARMQGNPLFAVQLVGDWVQAGLLEAGPSGFRLREGVLPEVPADALSLWSGRFERVLEDRRVEEVVALELAALLGTEVDAAEWREVCRRTMLPAPAGLVEELVRLGLARTGPEGLDAGWAFAHELLRDSVERRARAAGRAAGHHAACAEMLRQRTGPRIAERLGRHLVAAGQLADAADPLLRAARECLVRGEMDAAAGLVDEALAALDAAGAAEDDPLRGTAIVLREELAERRGQLEEAASWAERAVREGTRQNRPSLRAEGLGALGRVARQRGQLARAWLQLRRAERIALRAGARKVLAGARRHMGRLLGDRGELDRAAECYRLGLADFDAVGDEEGAAFCSWGIATLARKAGRHDDTVRQLGDARRRFEKCGSRMGVALCVNLLGEVARFRGQMDEAELHYRSALAGFRAVGSEGDASVVEFNLCLLLVHTGRCDEARGTLEAGLAKTRRAGRDALAVSILAALLPCAACARDWTAWDGHMSELAAASGRLAIVD